MYPRPALLSPPMLRLVSPAGSCRAGARLQSGVPRQVDAQPSVQPPAAFRRLAGQGMSSPDAYYEAHRRSLADPGAFWAAQARRLTWATPFDASRVLVGGFGALAPAAAGGAPDAAAPAAPVWFSGGALNVTASCLDAWVARGGGAAPALTFEADDGASETYSYAGALEAVCAMAAVLERAGVRRGDRVALYLPTTPALAWAMLACARLGAVHTAVFAGFSAEVRQHVASARERSRRPLSPDNRARAPCLRPPSAGAGRPHRQLRRGGGRDGRRGRARRQAGAAEARG
jgi:hypothetical protein